MTLFFKFLVVVSLIFLSPLFLFSQNNSSKTTLEKFIEEIQKEESKVKSQKNKQTKIDTLNLNIVPKAKTSQKNFINKDTNPYSEYHNLLAAIHLDSKISGGEYSLKELAEILNENKIDVGIYTDHDNMEIEYGLPFLRNFSITQEKNSISTFGEEEYLKEINSLRNHYGNLILLHGAEVIPYYFWEIDWESLTFKIKNFHKHLLVFGLETAEDYENLPSIKSGFENEFSFWYLLNIIPFITLWFGIRIFRTTLNTQVRKYGVLHDKVRGFKKEGSIIIVISVVYILNNFPYFVAPKYDQYENAGEKPYQELIEYVNSKGGMVFWAHPEKNNNLDLGKTFGINVRMQTSDYSNSLKETNGWTGFASFWEGAKKTGSIGGIWDYQLKQYSLNLKEKPTWAISELDYDGGDPENISESLTQIYTHERDQKGVLQALQKGRTVNFRNFAHRYLTFNEFSVKNSKDFKKIVGETLSLEKGENPVFRFDFEIDEKMKEKLTMFFIKDGKILEEKILARGENYFEIEDLDYSHRQTSFYRVIIAKGEKNFFIFMTNPIFVSSME